jgi:hypothetical protein
MSAPHEESRLWDLAWERAVRGLNAEQEAEFAALRTELTENELAELDLTVAATDIAVSSRHAVHLPPSVRTSIESRAIEHFRSGGILAAPATVYAEPKATVSIAHSRVGNRLIDLLGKLAVAASILIAAVLLFRSGPRTMSPNQLRDEVMADAQAIRATWSSGGHASGAQAAGEVIWSNRLQRGVMVFRGLSPNDPTAKQYQLWIFDKNQDDRYPIDGGVFDVPAGAAEVIVPIDAKLRVRQPTMFAVTLEKPGGVVVSSRAELPLLAKVEPQSI